MKKIPPGAEASNVLVGEVDFLERPIIAFVRLCPAVLLTGLTEVPVPTRLTTHIHTHCITCTHCVLTYSDMHSSRHKEDVAASGSESCVVNLVSECFL